jgi:hypothetical protein
MWSGNHKFYIQFSRLLRLQSFRITLYNLRGPTVSRRFRFCSAPSRGERYFSSTVLTTTFLSLFNTPLIAGRAIEGGTDGGDDGKMVRRDWYSNQGPVP